MITKLTLKNFKNIGTQVYDFTQFDLLVGSNNSGKSTILQALAIWQFCVAEFKESTRKGDRGKQIILPNFTALSVPEFNLLWKDRNVKKGSQQYIIISIHLEWLGSNSQNGSFGIELRYNSSQAIYAIPSGGWNVFRECEISDNLPKIVYVPPFSGLEPVETGLFEGKMSQNIGKGQPGSILRNLLLRVSNSANRSKSEGAPAEWIELTDVVQKWFGFKIQEPKYDSIRNVNIIVEYKKGATGKSYDIIAAGSGFHQTLTLLAFLYGYKSTTILLDEPDAHLHVNLQRKILDFFKKKSAERNIQFLIATHAEELVRGVDVSQVISLLSGKPERVSSTPEIIRAMADIANEEITRLQTSPYILYVEGESDERILRAWAEQCDARSVLDKFCFHIMGGGNKMEMKRNAEKHFASLKQIIPTVKKMALFDFDDTNLAFHPAVDNLGLAEWKRKNIENYLFVPEAWTRAMVKSLGFAENDLLNYELTSIIDTFFSDQNLTLPSGKTWRDVNANIFKVLNGKRILFENDDSLFHSLRTSAIPVKLIREDIARNMTSDEIHEDIHEFFHSLSSLVGASNID